MGGCCCCCCFPRRSEPIRTPNFYYCPRTSEERQPLSDHNGGPARLSSSGLLVDTNLDTSNPDMYTPPPAPIPYNVDLRHYQMPSPGSGGNHCPKRGPSDKAADTGSLAELGATVSAGSPEKDLKGVDGESQSSLELTPRDSEDDLKKPGGQIITTIEEEDCPICLEEYTEENPKMVTECEHHFHLCCILEWMERSDKCPVCDKEVVIDETINW